MKIRHGFVSNSSSSSFCIYGVTLNSVTGKTITEAVLDGDISFGENFIKEANEYFLKYGTQKDIDDKTEKYKESVYEAIIETSDCPSLPGNLYIKILPDSGETYIGRDIDDLGEDETKRQFKASIDEALKTIFGDKAKARWFEGTYYN